MAATIPRQRRLLRRSRSDRILGGVCGGLAYYFDTDPVLIRLIFIVITLAQGAGVLLYILLWVFMPEEGAEDPPAGRELVKSGIEGARQDVLEAAENLRAGAPHRQGAWLGALLIVVGGYLLAVNSGLLAGWDWTIVGPVLLIAAGLILVIRRLR